MCLILYLNYASNTMKMFLNWF